MQMSFVDKLAIWLPGFGGLVPAMMTYHHTLNVLRFEWWQAVLIGLVVEAIGFVAIATALDLYEFAGFGSHFWVAAGGTLVYLLVVISINALLDDSGWLEKTTKGMMASFGLLGGLMLALRNQLMKWREERAEARAQEKQAEAELRARQARIEDEEREFAHRLKEQRQAEKHEERMRKIEAESIRQPSAAPGESPEAPGMSPATRLRWSDVSPDDYRWIVDAHPAEIVKRYNITGKDPERLARTWKNYARTGLKTADNGQAAESRIETDGGKA